MDKALYIDGSWTQGTGSSQVDVINPATEQLMASVPEATVADVEQAISAARRQFDGGWGQTSPAARMVVLGRFVQALFDRRAEFVELAIAEAGAPRKLAETLQVQSPLDHFRDMVERVLPTFPFERPMPATFGNGIGQGTVLREPAGVVAAITPFNYPLTVSLNKVGPALAAGCTVVLKPSPYTPLTALLMAEAAHEAGLPAGAFNVVTGGVDESRLMTTHRDVDVVSFTGSDVVGAQILQQAAPGVKKVVLELGGKSANIVLDDADLDRAVMHAALSFTRHSGQGCACLTRVVIAESRHQEFVDRLIDVLASLKVGDPQSPDTDMGPLIRATQRTTVERHIASAQLEGAKLAFGGGRPPGLATGFYVEPTLFVNVHPDMRIAQEEVFGPVGVVISVADDAEAVAVANNSDFGLSGAVWSADPRRAFAVAKAIRTGNVVINGGGGGTNPHAPFGGYKRSGIGREFGEAGLEEFLETKAVMWGVVPR
jgi:aldehyde dehydrogenase (NAD+)